MKYFLLFGAFILLFNSSISAQKNHTISGYVKEDATGESLLGANVFVKETMKGTVTNQYGFFSLTIPEGNYTLVFSYIGFISQEFPISLTEDLRKSTSLKSNAIETKEVVITGEKQDRNVQSTEMGREKIEIEKIKTLPAFMGEVDILKTIQLLPGVSSAGEGNSGFYVRGGGPDQNLILLDEANVYNAAHLFGFFSVFNSDAVQNLTLTKGNMPANYGGRLSSVLDIQMKEGNNKKFGVQGGLGFVASRLTIEGPIKKDTSSFIISARRTFIDIFLAPPFISETSDISGNKYYFYDLNAKVNYRLSDKDRIFISGYFGRDVFKFKSPDSDFSLSIPWGNATATARWNHLFSNKLFLNTSAIYTNYDFQFEGGQEQFSFKLFSGITDYNLKTDFTWVPSPQHNVKFGANYIYHVFVPSNASARSGDVNFNLGDIVKQYAHDAALYFNDEFELNAKWLFNGGVRLTMFQQVGPFDRFILDPLTDLPTDTIHYDKGEAVATYPNIEPRFAVRYSINESSSLKASYSQNYQYIHLASLSGISLPTDTWVPSSDRVKPQFGTQYALGYFKNFKNNTYETSVEAYYKTMKNQIEYEEGFLPENQVNGNLDNFFVFGKGWSYGAEFFLKKSKGRFSGWIGYTLAWTKREFPELNLGKEFYPKYDRRHDVSVVLTYELGKRVVLGATWVYATGNLNTFPEKLYLLSNGDIVQDYGGQRNNYRMDPYHRMDVSVTWKGIESKKFESSWNFSVFNVYNRYNPYIIYFDNKVDNGVVTIEAKQISLFPILPSITYNFKF